MWVESVAAKFGSFDGMEPIQFSPGVNVIRGENGIGKTTILEFTSLLGHVALMQEAVDVGDERVDLVVNFDECDKQFLKIVKNSVGMQRDLISDCAILHLLDILSECGLPSGYLNEIEIPDNSFTLSFQFVDMQESQIKHVLSCDHRIRSHISVYSADVDLWLVRLLNLWSRPLCQGDADNLGPWSITPRTIHVGSNRESKSPCGATFYINTDMYEFGAGLDVRESPKELKENLTSVLIRRLQLVRPDNDVSPTVGLDSQFHLNIGRNIDKFDEIQKCWNEVFDNGPNLEACRAKRLIDSQVVGLRDGFKTQFQWTFKVGSRDRTEFVSSGENQAIFVLAMLCGMASPGSCVMIDEPELHLTFAAGSRLVRLIFDLAHDENGGFQVILVTHLPHLHRSKVAELDTLRDRRAENNGKINFIYLHRVKDSVLPVYGHDGVEEAARTSHEDVVELAKGLELSRKVSIWRL